MTIEQAIQNCKDKAKKLRANARLFSSSPMYDKTDISYTLGCADEQEQLAHWLEDLVDLNRVRPTGEWIIDKDVFCKCPFCNFKDVKYSNYCPDCGARLKGGAE